jgi:hypothetical protein
MNFGDVSFKCPKSLFLTVTSVTYPAVLCCKGKRGWKKRCR